MKRSTREEHRGWLLGKQLRKSDYTHMRHELAKLHCDMEENLASNRFVQTSCTHKGTHVNSHCRVLLVFHAADVAESRQLGRESSSATGKFAVSPVSNTGAKTEQHAHQLCQLTHQL